jgi:hypothetical protein
MKRGKRARAAAPDNEPGARRAPELITVTCRQTPAGKQKPQRASYFIVNDMYANDTLDLYV